MWKLGLTGSIATGKSTVLKAFAELGVPVFSSDDAVHELYRGEAVPPVEALFPGVSHNGEVDRAALSRASVAAARTARGARSGWSIRWCARGSRTFLADGRKPRRAARRRRCAAAVRDRLTTTASTASR